MTVALAAFTALGPLLLLAMVSARYGDLIANEYVNSRLHEAAAPASQVVDQHFNVLSLNIASYATRPAISLRSTILRATWSLWHIARARRTSPV